MDESEDPEYTASLRLFSKTKSLDELEAALGKASNGYSVRDPFSARHPDRQRDASFWGLESTVERTERLDLHVEELVAFVESHRDALRALSPEWEVDIFCGVFSGDSVNCSFVLEPDLSRRLSDLRLSVTFDCC